MNKKITQALKTGKLIQLDQFLDKYSAEQKRQIDEQVKYLQAAMAVRELRRRLKLSQEKLAKKMQVKREFISRLESGRQNITLSTLYKISSATGQDLRFNFG